MPSILPGLRGPQADLQFTQYDGNLIDNYEDIIKQKKVKPQKPKTNKMTSTIQPLLANLPGPFSRLAGFEHIPLYDIESFVNRSVETRQVELEKRWSKQKFESKIPRPLNGFLLYRKCYLGRAQAFCKTGDQRCFSSVLGASWKLETREVRDRFLDLSKVECQKHRETFPEYKFQPKQLVKAISDDEDEELEDTTIAAPNSAYEWHPAWAPGYVAQPGMGCMPTGSVFQGNNFHSGPDWQLYQMQQHGSSVPRYRNPHFPKDVTLPQMYHPQYPLAAHSAATFPPNNTPNWNPLTYATTSADNMDFTLLYPELAEEYSRLPTY